MALRCWKTKLESPQLEEKVAKENMVRREDDI